MELPSKTCAICGEAFTKKPTNSRTTWAKARFCSRSCYHVWWKANVQRKFVDNGAASRRGKPMPEAHRKAIGDGNRGNPRPWQQGQPSPFKGRKHTEEAKAQISRNRRGKNAGPESASWKGGPDEAGYYPRTYAMGQSPYKDWRRQVFERDDWTCQECGERGGKLHAHHIEKWSENPDLRYDPTNGTTLCRDCHRKTHRKS